MHANVAPAQAGTHRATHTGLWNMGPRLRGDDSTGQSIPGWAMAERGAGRALLARVDVEVDDADAARFEH